MYTGTLKTWLELPVKIEYEAGMDIEIKNIFISTWPCSDSLTPLQRDTLVKEIKSQLDKERQTAVENSYEPS